jgi:hypothetical protein
MSYDDAWYWSLELGTVGFDLIRGLALVRFGSILRNDFKRSLCFF